MKIENIELCKIIENEKNPRLIQDDNFNRLVNSILVFPKMLILRPIIVDQSADTFIALGGNMRYRALIFISGLTEEQIKERLQSLDDFNRKKETDQNTLIEYWNNWLKKLVVPAVNASELSDDEKKAFIIKDNLSFGEWDFDILATDWDIDELKDWGLEVEFNTLDWEDEKLPPIPSDLTRDKKDNLPFIKISFANYKQLDEFRKDIASILEKFKGSNYTIGGGEI